MGFSCYLCVNKIISMESKIKILSYYIAEDENGLPAYRSFDYLYFYENKLRPYDEVEYEGVNHRVYEGDVDVDDFYERHKDKMRDVVESLLQDERLGQLQDELQEEGKSVCVVNLYILAKYLIEKNKSRHLLLLKPSLSETLSSLKDVSEIRFVNKDGTMAESTSDALIKKIMDTLKKESPAANYEVEKIVTWDDVSNNSIMQGYFVYDLTMFLNKHFPVKRKKDALVSTKEVELILYLMKLFGLSTVELTNKRYWQLMKTCKDVDKQIKEHRLLINHEGAIIPFYLIPYSVWNNSKIEWNDENTSKFDAGDSFVIKL